MRRHSTGIAEPDAKPTIRNGEGRNYPVARILAARLRNPAVFTTQPTRDMNSVVIQSWAPGRDPVESDEWRDKKPSPVPSVRGDGDLTLYRILRDEEPGIPSGS